MNLGDLADLATIAESIFVTVSVIFIWIQVNQNLKLTKSANAQSLVQLSSPFNILLAQDLKLLKLWLDGAKNYQRMSKIKQAQYMSLVSHVMTLQENIYYQKVNGLIDNDLYLSWERSFRNFSKEHNLKSHWANIRDLYDVKFAEHVDKMLN